MLWHLGNTDVVASVYYESVKLVRHSYRHSEVESVYVFHVVLAYHECGLKTCLEGKVLGHIIVECYRNVQIARVLRVVVVFATLERIEKSTGQTHLACKLMLDLSTEYEACLPVKVTYGRYIQTDFRLNSSRTCSALCESTN